MSDDDDMMYDEDFDEVEEEGDNDAAEEESDGVEIENQYYNSKGMRPQPYVSCISYSPRCTSTHRGLYC